jgi:hypothetical protein
MKKIFVLLLIIITNYTYSQKINCWKCSGRGKISTRDWIVCSNCKDWSNSYKSKVPCNVCKDNRGYSTSYYDIVCSVCNGSGRNYDAEKRVNYEREVAAAERKKEEEKIKEEEEKKATFRNSVPSTNNIKIDLFYKKVGTWTFEGLYEIESINIYNTERLNSDSNLYVFVKMDLKVIYPSLKLYKADLKLAYYNNNDNEWMFQYIDDCCSTVVEKIKTTYNSTQNQTVDKTDDTAFNKTNVDYRNTGSSIKFYVNEPSKIDIMNMFLTNKEQQILGINAWDFLSKVLALTDNGEVSSLTKIRIEDRKGIFILLTKDDGEKFEIAKRFIQQMKDKIK